MSFSINVTNYYDEVASQPVDIKNKEYLYELDCLSYIRETNKVIFVVSSIVTVASLILGFNPRNAVVFATVSAFVFITVNAKLEKEDLKAKMLLNTIKNTNTF